MVVGVVFVLSNVTDDLKGVVVAATQRYADWVQALIIAKGTLGWALSGNYSYNPRRQRHRPPVPLSPTERRRPIVVPPGVKAQAPAEETIGGDESAIGGDE